jgi:hypothetical protein
MIFICFTAAILTRTRFWIKIRKQRDKDFLPSFSSSLLYLSFPDEKIPCVRKIILGGLPRK